MMLIPDLNAGLWFFLKKRDEIWTDTVFLIKITINTVLVIKNHFIGENHQCPGKS